MSTQKQDTCLPPKRYYQFAILKPRPTYRIHRKNNTAIDQPTPKRSHPNPVYNPDSNSLPASVAGSRFVTFQGGDRAALVPPPPPPASSGRPPKEESSKSSIQSRQQLATGQCGRDPLCHFQAWRRFCAGPSTTNAP